MAFERSLSVKGDLLDELNREVRGVSLNLLRGLIRLTPVDTGRAKGNWFVSIANPNREISNDRRQAQAFSEGAINIALAKGRAYPTVTISNNLPYIERLNDGYSMQAPKKFVETELDRIVNARIDAND